MLVPKRLETGSLVLRRMYRGEHVIWVQACRVVRDDSAGLLLWLPVGAGFAHRPNPAGERSPRVAAELADQPLRVETWREHDVLILVPPGAPHSVWWFFRDGEFAFWYVNLERPSVRWSREGSAGSDGSVADGITGSNGITGLNGVDSFDHALDVVATRDGAWRWKDEDELAERIGLPGYWDADGAARIQLDGERVVAEIESGRAPFDGSWCDFRPDPSWIAAALPGAGWDTPPAWSPQPSAPTAPTTAPPMRGRVG